MSILDQLTPESVAKLRLELDALQKVKTQEEFDEGARLHHEKNAPWANGPYTHLLDPAGRLKGAPPYVHQAFPRMLYHADYEAACLAWDDAWRIPARGDDDAQRADALRVAERRKQLATCVVQSDAEMDGRLSRGWFISSTAAVAAKKAELDELAVQAAHRAYDDRNMGDQAKREIEAVDDAADTFVAEIPQRKRPGRRKKVVLQEA